MRLQWLAFALLASLAVAAAPAPTVRSVEVRSTGGDAVDRDKLLSNMQTRVGERYSEKAIEEDIRQIQKIGIPIRRIFGEPVPNGVAIIVIVQSRAEIPRVEWLDVMPQEPARASGGLGSPAPLQLELPLSARDNVQRTLSLDAGPSHSFSIGPNPTGMVKVSILGSPSIPDSAPVSWPPCPLDVPGPEYRRQRDPIHPPRRRSMQSWKV